MKKEITINVRKEAATVISSQDIISKLANIIEKTEVKGVVLDFDNVEFISRSATHALLKLKEKYNNKWSLLNKKTVMFVNINRSFNKMLQSVVASRKYMKRKINFNPERVSSKALFEKNLI